jgi:hypothetical protein
MERMMIKHGRAPYLECSSRGDKRFSPFFAYVDGVSIETAYQAAKVFDDGTTGLGWREAKGRKPINQAECSALYSKLWTHYLSMHPELMPVLVEATGLSDMFGQHGAPCQATELWRIRTEYIDARCTCWFAFPR